MNDFHLDFPISVPGIGSTQFHEIRSSEPRFFLPIAEEPQFHRRGRTCSDTRPGRFCQQLQILEFVLRQTGLPENGSEGAGWHIRCVYGNISLPPVGMSQNNMRTGLPSNGKSRSLQPGQDITRLVEHRRRIPRSRRTIRPALERVRDWPSFPRSTVATNRELLPVLLRHQTREWSVPAREHERNNGPVESPDPQCAQTESHTLCRKPSPPGLANQVCRLALDCRGRRNLELPDLMVASSILDLGKGEDRSGCGSHFGGSCAKNRLKPELQTSIDGRLQGLEFRLQAVSIQSLLHVFPFSLSILAGHPRRSSGAPRFDWDHSSQESTG